MSKSQMLHWSTYRGTCQKKYKIVFSPKSMVELAFAFGRRFWGQGYAFEACTALIHYAFEELRLQRLLNTFLEPNTRSRNLHQRLGYQIEPNLHPDEPGTYVAILNNFLT